MDKKSERPEGIHPFLWENPMRNIYRDSVNEYVNRKKQTLVKERDRLLNRSEAERRQAFLQMLGEPLVGDSDKTVRLLETETVYQDETLVAERYTFEVLGCIRFWGILYRAVKQTEGKKALVFALHGGGGTPERVGDLFHDSANYNNMVRRVLTENTLVFAPQLMLWNPDVYASPYDREWLNRRLIQQGGSFTGLEVFCLMRVTDYFEQDPRVDKDRIGVIGLSYGGMYALHFSAADTRIKSTVSDCWFSDRSVHAWHDWAYFGAEKTFFDTEVAALVLPRKLYIEIGDQDPMFRLGEAEAERERLLAYAKRAGVEDRLCFVVFDGNHELNRDNATITSFLQDLA